MRDILFFAIGASIVGTVFLVSVVELIFTIRRRKSHYQVENKIKELRAQYNESINKLVLENEEKIQGSEQLTQQLNQKIEEEKQTLEEDYRKKITDLTRANSKALATAKQKAKKMQHEAELRAEEYLANRQKEVEKELMQLVMSVSKKVLPQGISYDAQKELVMRALKEVKADK